MTLALNNRFHCSRKKKRSTDDEDGCEAKKLRGQHDTFQQLIVGR